MKVVVGSKNPVKIQATKEAFEKLWPKKNRSVIGLEVKSGVSDQPMSDEESIKGASNRAKKALKTGKADFGIGFEGGLHKIGEKWFDCGWVVVVNKKALPDNLPAECCPSCLLNVVNNDCFQL